MQATRLQGFALSTQQTHLWMSRHNRQTYRTLGAIQIEGELDRDAFRQAIEQVIMRHEILRTVFVCMSGMDLPLQVVCDRALWLYTEIGLEHLTTDEQSRTVEELFAAMREEMYDLQEGPTVFVRLCTFHAQQHGALISLPALCADSLSWKIFLEDVLATYSQQELEEDILQYADISAWQEEQLAEEEAAPHLAYWHQKALTFPQTRLHLPFAQEGQKTATSQAVEIKLPERYIQQIQAQAQQYNASISDWLLASFYIFLRRIGQETNGIVGVGCDGRPYDELTRALGPYMRFVPVEAHIEQDASFVAALTEVQASLQEAKKRQLYFTWDEQSEYRSNDSSQPFLPVIFEYETYPTDLETTGIRAKVLKRWSETEPYVLKLSAVQIGTALHIQLSAGAQEATQEQTETMGEVFLTILEQTVAQPLSSMGTIALLNPAQRTHLLQTYQAPQQHWTEQTFQQLFEAQVRRSPTALAVIDAQERFTYQELNEQANRLAAILHRRGVGPNVVVGLCLNRSGRMLVALLAILKAGGAYLPLEASHPPARLHYQLQECSTRLLLTQQELHSALPPWGGHTLYLEELTSELANASAQDQPIDSRREDLAYVIYTSGSTGKPKGVMVRQSSVVNYTLALCQQLDARPGWQYATVSTLAADLGNTAIFCALASGGCVQVLDTEIVTSGAAMATWAQQHPIDVLKIVPSHLSALLEHSQAHLFLPRRALVLGGEALSERLVGRIQEARVTCQIYNHYGPTEATVGVLVLPLSSLREEPSSQQLIPLGPPIANAQVMILDQSLHITPPGMTGELYIGGAGLAWGYVGQGAQTAERFVPHPYSTVPGARLYRTGDLVRYGANGTLEFVGRIDGQVKLRGYRIEVGEIEAVLHEHPLVRESVVLLRSRAEEEPRLIGYIVGQQRGEIAPEQLETWAREHLPAYMVPQEYMQLEEWPLTANGKIDRKRLLTFAPTKASFKRTGMEARSPLEELIVQIWRTTLGDANLGIHENFFTVGGHSLLATRVIARMQAVLQIALPVRALFDAPTVVELAQVVEQLLRGSEALSAPPLVARPRPAEIPLSFAQQRLWFLHQFAPESTAYLASRSLKALGPLQVASLEVSLQELIRRHESLRTTFVLQGESPVQIIASEGETSLFVIDLQGLTPQDRESETQRLLSQEREAPCDISRGPLMRTALMRRAIHEHHLVVTLHHIITDGWSNEVLIRELATLYETQVACQPSPLAPLPIQYADYALWQRDWLQGERREAQRRYWQKQLADMTPLDLPTDHPRSARQSYQGTVSLVEWPDSISQGVLALSQREGVTPFMLLLAGFQVLLQRYSGKTDISVGTPIANRTRSEVEEVIGFFVNTLVIRADLAGNPSFRQVLQLIREACLGAYMHQDLPFEQVVELLQLERDVNRPLPFPVSFQYVEEQPPIRQIANLQIEASGLDGASADYDLRVQMTHIEQRLSCTIYYDRALFEAETIERLQEHFQTLLQGILDNPEQPLAQLPMLTAPEYHQQLIEWNTTRQAFPQEPLIHQLFEQQVERTPDAIALVFDEQAVSYAELNRRANQLAHHLQRLGVGAGRLVGIHLERSLEMVIALLGVLKAEGAYVPLDPTYPRERLVFMLREAHIAFLLTKQPGVTSSLRAANMVAIDLQNHWASIATQSSDNLQTRATAESLAYVIYTSGSTGVPKAVGIFHRGVVNLLHWYREIIAKQERVLLVSSISFDLTQKNVFTPLLSGGTVHLVPGEYYDPLQLIRQIAEQQITLLNCTPSTFYPLIEHLPAEQWGALDSLRSVILGGEPIAYARLAAWMQSSTCHAQVVNTYGPTECSDIALYFVLAPDGQYQSSNAPLGRPIANVQVVIVDEGLFLVPRGVAGELCIAGVGVGMGYLNDAAMTAGRFIPNPFPEIDGTRLYRTGDRARYLPDGNIEFLGRVDHQVKLRGFRMELGEIEAVLRDHPAVQEAVAMVQEDRVGDARLVGYVVLDLLATEENSQEAGGALSTERLQHWQQVYDETYRQKAAEQTFNLAGWNSSYTGQPLPVTEMRAWLDDTLDLIQACQPKNTWEIGCGTGLLLFPLTQICTRYYGTDFSATVLEGVRHHLEQLQATESHRAAVTLLHRSADDFSAFPEEPIDTILINSVIQYFPSLDYLLRVLDGAVHRVAPGGRIIVGDIRSLPLLEAFHADVALARASETQTRQQLQQQVRQQVQQESELVLDPALFRQWAQTTGRVNRVEIRLKRGRQANELTRFRYQVVLHVGETSVAEQVETSRPQAEELNWHTYGLTFEQLRQKIERERPARLRLRQIPNARIEHALKTLHWLRGEEDGESVGLWREAWATLPKQGIEPEDLWSLAEEFGYQATISWEQHDTEGRYTALLQREGEIDEEEWLQPTNQAKPARNWQHYANHPLCRETERQMAPQLRQYLQERLPEYMVPTHLEILPAFPLTPNGKLDRRALPSPTSELRSERTEHKALLSPIEELIGGFWSGLLACGSVGAEENFFELGGHSLLVMQLVARIRASLEIEVPVRVAFEHPTLGGMARWVEQALRNREMIDAPSIQIAASRDLIPLSFAQQRLWFLEQLHPNSTLYLGSEVLIFRGLLDRRALELSIQAIVQRHESLRTTFSVKNELPVQVIAPASRVVIPVVDLQALRPEQRTQKAMLQAARAAQLPCNLETGPLFRIFLFHLGAQEHLLGLTVHHIITDGWSNDILVRELSWLYRSYHMEQQPAPLEPLPIQYADYALWQRQWLQGTRLQQHIAYWEQQLQGASPLELPADTPRGARGREEAGARYRFALAPELARAVAALSRSEDATLFMTLLAAFQILLSRLSNQADVVVGTDVANRTQVETEGLIGFFVNLVALRTQLQGSLSFRKLMQQIRNTVLEAYTHQELPFEVVVEHVPLARKEVQMPLVQVLCVMQNTPGGIFHLPDVEMEMIEQQDTIARFDLALFLREEAGGITGSVVYQTGLFHGQTIASWMRQFEVLLSNIVAQPDMAIDRLETLTVEEKAAQAAEKEAKRLQKAKRLKLAKGKEVEPDEPN